MKTKVNIRLNTSENLGRFINVCSKEIYRDVDINAIHGRFIVDAKSVLGVMSLGVDKDVLVEIVTDNVMLAAMFMEDMKDFEVMND